MTTWSRRRKIPRRSTRSISPRRKSRPLSPKGLIPTVHGRRYETYRVSQIIGDGNSEVYLADGDGSNPRNLTNNPFFDGWPAWSPDGRKIAFASNRRGHGYQIFIMDVDGANPRLVANTEGRGTAPRWSPGGKSIYFVNCVEKDYGTDCEILVARLGLQPPGGH